MNRHATAATKHATRATRHATRACAALQLLPSCRNKCAALRTMRMMSMLPAGTSGRQATSATHVALECLSTS
jgi:hypothetical protein